MAKKKEARKRVSDKYVEALRAVNDCAMITTWVKGNEDDI